MGVEKKVCNGTAHRCTKVPFVDIYRPPPLRCQSIEGSDTNATAIARQNNETTHHHTASTVISSSISCNNSPAHAKERNNLHSTLTPSTSTSRGAAPPRSPTHSTNNVTQSEPPPSQQQQRQQQQQQQQQQQANATATGSRRERRPDRAVYIPRARRSQTTPPTAAMAAATTPQAQHRQAVPMTTTTPTPSNNIGEQQLPNRLNTNGLVPKLTSTKTDDSKKKARKKSQTSCSTKERTKNNQMTKHSNQVAQQMDNVFGDETKDLNIKSLINCKKQSKIVERNYDKIVEMKAAAAAANCKQLESFELPKNPLPESKTIKSCVSNEINNSNVISSEFSDEHPNTTQHIEDALTIDRVTTKCDTDAQELHKASREINRSNRRIIKQTFASDILEIPDKIENMNAKDNTKLSTSAKNRFPISNARSNIEITTDKEKALAEEEEQQQQDEETAEDDWESMFDESGECLDPTIIQELTASVGKVKIEFPKMDYSLYLTKQTLLNDEEYPHVLEVSNFPVEFKNQDLLMLFSQYKESGFDIKWVDDTHALAIFSSSRIAAEALAMGHPFVILRPLAEATLESRLKAKKCAASLKPYRPRPETCAALARRLVTGALGVRLKTAAAERENEKRVLREAKERKLLAAKQRDEAWES